MMVLYVFIGFLLLGGYIYIISQYKHKISHADKVKIAKQWHYVLSIHDTERQILEADKVVHSLFIALGHTGSFGEILKRSGHTFANLDALWSAHKLRNRIAHEPGVRISEKEAKKALDTFEKFIASYV